MPPTDKIQMTDPQREAVGQVMADAVGANIQSGRRLIPESDTSVYVGWQFGPNTPVRFAFIDEKGTVTYAKDN